MNIHRIVFTYRQLYANTFTRYLYLIYTNYIGASFSFEACLIKISRKIDTYFFQNIYILVYNFEVFFRIKSMSSPMCEFTVYTFI